MSNYLAIATVTEAIMQIINQGLSDDQISGVLVSAKPPDSIDIGSPHNQINLSLYQVTPNVGYRNMDLPTRDAQGNIVKTPQIALDLHYLISVYASKNDEIMSQKILASMIRAMGENPIISSSLINQIKTMPQFVDTDLDEQHEIVRFSFEMLPMEEITKLWSSFFQTNYRLSVFYKASVVLINSKKIPRVSLPVQNPMFYVQPFMHAVIETASLQNPQWDANALLKLQGQNLQIEKLVVNVDGQDMVPNPSDISDTQVLVKLSNSITPGIKQVKITQPLTLGKPGLPHSGGFESNSTTFKISPLIVDGNGSTNPANSFSLKRGDDLVIYFQPYATVDQLVSVVMGDQSFTLRPPPVGGPPKVNSITLTIPSDFPLGRHPLRLQIDGAESLLTIDKDPTSTSFGQYAIPYVDVTP